MSQFLKYLTSSTPTVEQETPVTQIEREYCWYGIVEDFSELAKAGSIEDHEQWEIRPTETNTGCIRVRATTPIRYNHEDSTSHAIGDTVYTMTTKVYRGQYEGVSDSIEKTIEITEDFFLSFKKIAPSGMVKRRFNFFIEGTDRKWEVDAFIDDEGGFHPWVKVDLEVSESEEGDVPKLPVTLTNILYSKDASKRKEIANKYFVRKNPNAK